MGAFISGFFEILEAVATIGAAYLVSDRPPPPPSSGVSYGFSRPNVQVRSVPGPVYLSNPPEPYVEPTVDRHEQSEVPRTVGHLLPSHQDYMRKFPPTLHPNIVQGQYLGNADYLEVQVKLLREDFVRPIIECVQKCYETNCAEDVCKLKNVAFFRCVEFLGVGLDGPRTQFIFKASSSHKMDIFSKLAPGTLLCITNDCFWTIQYATIRDTAKVQEIIADWNRKPSNRYYQIRVDLEPGQKFVQLICDATEINFFRFKKFEAFESPTCYPAYRSPFESLAKMKGTSVVPFSRNIVEVRKTTKLPLYLRGHEAHNLTDIAKADQIGIHFCNCKLMSVNLFNRSAIPHDLLALNTWQWKAFRAALTSEFSLIQGPPGTGKSYIALKLVEVLLTNEALWKTTLLCPILIVSYKNKSLDQFLEKVLKITTNVLRFGHKDSTSQVMRRYAVEPFATVSQTCQIIGMTVTGAAKNHELLKSIGVKIVIVEEAAEILEPFLVAAIPVTAQHIIMIGDHKQLQPIPAVNQHATLYKMDISLFERMVSNGVQYDQLVVQRRMRPEISSLLVPTFYKKLEDHETVQGRADVAGMPANVYFFNHAEPEKASGTSFTNEFEAKFVIYLLIRLLGNGHKSTRIIVLAAYGAQVAEIKKVMGTSRLAEMLAGYNFVVGTLDSYQGNENDIIIISFVRSNDDGKIGFLFKPNRLCVAMSRARLGLYCVGNFTMLASKSVMWRKIVTGLTKKNSFGDCSSF